MARGQCFAGLREAPSPQDTGQLANLPGQLQGTKDGVQACLVQGQAGEDERAGFSQQVRTWLEQNQACPACGQALDEAVLMSGGIHGH